jgi:hypothetical protein
VRHQVADLHLRDVAERIVREPQLRHVLDDRVVEREQAAIAQLHDRDTGERLGDRSPVKAGLLVDAARRDLRPSFCRATIRPRAIPSGCCDNPALLEGAAVTVNDDRLDAGGCAARGGPQSGGDGKGGGVVRMFQTGAIVA